MSKRLRYKIRRLRRRLERHKPLLAVGGVALAIAVGAMYVNQRQLVVDPASYQPLLRLIGQAESSDNYNAYFGNPDNVDLQLTDMTLAQVLQWQHQYVQQGSPSDAVGRYQIISPTLSGLVDQLDIAPTALFDAAMQDRLAQALLQRRGGDQYINRRISAEQFAANLAMEWAALPRVLGDNPDHSYYAGDGLNQSRATVGQVLGAIGDVKAR